jgi:ABC-type nitrate/sulfonate/bicarbonate transport system permease component
MTGAAEAARMAPPGGARRSAAARALHSPVLGGLLGVVALAAMLEVAILTGWVSDQAVALPTAALGAIPDLYSESQITGAFLVTLGMTGAATAIAVLIGVPFGWLLWRSHTLGEAYESWLAAAFSAPLVLLYPLFLVLIGRNHMTLIVMGFIPGTIPIAIQTRQGLLAVSRTLINVGRSFHVDRPTMFWKIMLPAAVPTIFNGIRLGVMYTLVSVVAIEYLTDFGGLGRVVSDEYFHYRIAGTYGAIMFVVLVSVLFYWAFGRIERWLRPA